MKKFLLLFAMCFAFVHVWAQERTVSGKVTSAEDGTDLPGVNVVVKGTSTGAVTDIDGNYSVRVPSQGGTLVFSFIGLSSQEVEIGSRSVIDIQMESDVTQLSEVVVVAYGEQTRRSIVGSVASVGSELIGKQQVTSIATSIQGAVPGVNIISAGGQPGDNPTIRIRGIGSINASAEPLIVLNGVPFNGNINTISADQIESINVLKDASSTALYGSRASNGVILITTKKGKRNTPATFSFNTTVGTANQAVDFPDFVGTDQYTQLAWEAVKNSYQYVDGETAADAAQMASDNLVSDFLQYNPYTLANPVDTDGNLINSEKNWDTDWADEIVNNNALRQEHSLSVSGGSENTSYFFSGNYLMQEGAVKTSEFERASVRISMDSKINDWFSAGFNAGYSSQGQNYPSQSGSSYQSAIQWIFSVPSLYPLHRRTESGDLILDNAGNPIYDYGNAVGQLLNGSRPALAGENAVGALYNYKIYNNRDNFNAVTYGKVNFTDFLSFTSTLGYEKYLFDGFTYAHNEFGYAANVGGRVSQDRDVTTTFNLTNSLNFFKSFDNHNLDILLLQESYKANIDNMSAQGTGFLPNVLVLNGSTTPEGVGGFIAEERLSSYMARAQYNFSNRYFIEGSFRRDGTSRFADRWGNFFSVGGAWIMSDEAFFDNIREVISFVKFKASYGELGNNKTLYSDGTGNFFPYLQGFDVGWNQGTNTGVLLSSVVDPALTWEKTASSNFGVEMRFFNDRLSTNVEYYIRESVDLINPKPLPASTGNSSILTNVGSLKNYGLEVTINSANVKTPDFVWTTGLNFSLDHNEITELTQEFFINGSKRWEVGRSLYDFWIQDWAGVNPDNGYGMWYKDVLDDEGEPTGERETTEVYSEATRYYVDKSSLPKVIGGLTNYIRFKNFDMNLFFNYSFGGYIYDGQYAGLMGSMESPGNGASHSDINNRWRQAGDITDVPLLLASNNDFNAQSTRFLFKNNYVRLKAVNIGYNLPTNFTDKLGIQGLRVFFQGDNLLTFQSHKKGLDPEQSLAGTTNNRSYNQKITSLGLNLTF